MPPKQRQIKVQQTNSLAAMQQLESRTDDELLREQKYKSAAMAILGSRAAERYDAKASREYYRRAMAAARPQERMALRRMSDASLALAERRPNDLRAAVERLGQDAPSKWSLRFLLLSGYLVPPPGASLLLRARGIFLILMLVVAALAIGAAIAFVIALPFGGVALLSSLYLGVLVVLIALGGMYLFGRRRQNAAKAKRSAA
jgi:hypothetical protein